MDAASYPFSAYTCLGAVFDVAVRQPQSTHLGLVPLVTHELQHCTSEATHDAPVFQGDDVLEFAEHLVQHHLVNRLGKAHVVVRRRDAAMGQGLTGFRGLGSNGTNAEDGDVIAVLQLVVLCRWAGLRRVASNQRWTPYRADSGWNRGSCNCEAEYIMLRNSTSSMGAATTMFGMQRM